MSDDIKIMLGAMHADIKNIREDVREFNGKISAIEKDLEPIKASHKFYTGLIKYILGPSLVALLATGVAIARALGQ